MVPSSKTRSGSYLSVVLICMVILSGCSSDEDHNQAVLNEYFDKELATISVGLALVNAQSLAWTRICQTFKEASPALFLKECNIYGEAAKQTSEIVKSTLQTKTLPDQAFLFYAWHGKNGASLGLLTTENGDYPVGLFKTLEDCQKAEQSFRASDINTRFCRQWKDSEEYMRGMTEDLARLVAAGRS